jgi:hypothetical protein
LWERDVVEVFLSPDTNAPGRYFEFEVAPTGEKLDLSITPESKAMAWNSGFEAVARVDRARERWTVEMRIPLEAVGLSGMPEGTQCRLNLYRNDRAGHTFLAWSPTASGTAHRPEKFGTLILAR